MNVLVVEDHDLNRELLTLIVEGEGHRVVPAASVAEVHARLSEETVELILMDVNLPDGDGLDLVAELRGSGRFDDVPIYAVTAYLMGETQGRALASGCDGLFEKPIDTTLLRPVLQQRR